MAAVTLLRYIICGQPLTERSGMKGVLRGEGGGPHHSVYSTLVALRVIHTVLKLLLSSRDCMTSEPGAPF